MRIRALAIIVAVAAGAIAQDLPRAKWIENGLIDAGGNHEPTIFVIRRGGQRLDAREQNERAESADALRRLKAQGIEVFHTHFYKGFGMAAEMPGMEETKHTAEVAHRLGLKVDTYIQWNSMMYETFFAEEPRAQNWIQRDARGRPILLTYGYQQSYRYRPCFANQEYLDYLKKIVRYAVEEVKTDFIHFDNFDLNPEPDSCHGETCVRGLPRLPANRSTRRSSGKNGSASRTSTTSTRREWNSKPAVEDADHLRPRHPGVDRLPLPDHGGRAGSRWHSMPSRSIPRW